MLEYPVTEEYQNPETYVTGVLKWDISKGIASYRNMLVGKVLTIIDASIADKEQRKAIKDLIKNEFYTINYLDKTGIQYAMTSLSKFLRKFTKEGSTEEEEEYKKYLDIQSFTNMEKDLYEKFQNAKLG